jgi:hypothetical protein
MASKQITKRLIDSLKPHSGQYFVWNGSLAGYGVRVKTTGAMAYVIKYRAGSGRTAPTRRLTLAKVGTGKKLIQAWQSGNRRILAEMMGGEITRIRPDTLEADAS